MRAVPSSGVCAGIRRAPAARGRDQGGGPRRQEAGQRQATAERQGRADRRPGTAPPAPLGPSRRGRTARPRSPRLSPCSARCSRAVSPSRVAASARSRPQKLRISSMATARGHTGGSRHSFEPLGDARVRSRESWSLARGMPGPAPRARFRRRGRTSGAGASGSEGRGAPGALQR